MAGIATQGMKLEVQLTAGPPATWQEVLGITNIQAFDGQAAEIDTTTLKSTAKERIIGIQDHGNVSVDANYLPADTGQNLMRTAKSTSARKIFRITYSTGATVVYGGYVMSAPRNGGVDDKVTTSFNILVDGDITDAPAP